ncbi:MAG: hypothetical protein JWR58_1191 [Pseudonocardia sp.]|jgi:hypothetical protein|nr:hypothetical protein [Pseudonocardia sp.]
MARSLATTAHAISRWATCIRRPETVAPTVTSDVLLAGAATPGALRPSLPKTR